MAREVITTVLVTDDLTGQKLTEEEALVVTFTWEGVGYEMDVSTDTAKQIQELMRPYLDAARKVKGRPGPKPRAKSALDEEPRRSGGQPGPRRTRRDMIAIAEWGRANGFGDDIPVKRGDGRMPEAVIKAYEKVYPRD